MGVDVAVVSYGDPDAAARFVASLRDTGFAVLVDHPLPPSLVRTVQDDWQAFFESDEKWSFRPDPGTQAGYFPMEATETAVGASVADIKEYFHWYPTGRSPRGPGRSAAELYDATVAVATELLGWLAAETPDDVLARLAVPLAAMLEGSRRTLLRILRYPPVTGDETPGALRAAPHEDINLLTMLPAANQPGLQVRDTGGAWLDVPGDPGSLVVNTGDMLERATGGHYPSTTHRVLLPDGPGGRVARMSTPLFLHPADDVELAPGSTAFGFLTERLRAISGIDLSA